MKRANITSKLFSISCKSSNEVLERILRHISKAGHQLCTLSQSLTDVQGVILLSIELEIEGRLVDTFLEEILEIDGILDATVSFGSVLQVATYQIKFDSNSLEILNITKSHNTQIINIEADRLLILHIASERDIRLLYNKLDNASLLGFCKIPLALGQSLAWNEIG